LHDATASYRAVFRVAAAPIANRIDSIWSDTALVEFPNVLEQEMAKNHRQLPPSITSDIE